MLDLLVKNRVQNDQWTILAGDSRRPTPALVAVVLQHANDDLIAFARFSIFFHS